MSRLLGIDLGTTSFKAVIYDEHGKILSSSRISPPDEQILVDGFRVTVWRSEKLWEVVCALVRRAVDALPDPSLDAVAIAELGLVGYPVDNSGNALYAGVTWIDPTAPTSRLSAVVAWTMPRSSAPREITSVPSIRRRGSRGWPSTNRPTPAA